MPHVRFRTSSGHKIYFKDNGDPQAYYDIVKWQSIPAVGLRTVSFHGCPSPGDTDRLLRIGEQLMAPTLVQIYCLLRQVTFGIVFTISVSSVLAKTFTVIIAFNATKPGSKLKKYVGTQLAIILVIVCSFGEIVVSAVWLASNPPFPEADTLSDPDYIILLCNEGSELFFFCIIGYIGTLALLSFIAAFLAKDFPDRFNEAKNITFSMLGFCSVWGAFVPAYLSSKGSRMVAVEIFAILSSNAGLLACIFIPKCYIIFIRSELNTKETIIRKQ
uniref:G-protein coupled receptors family 3 profile domain-containing protein n=1 Tax=Xenopus tropicalis TaxID=8364 RepID=A0A1B8YAF2_XENTR